MKNNILQLLNGLKIPFKNFNLYESAFTHSSIHGDPIKKEDYEVLEFLGDSVISLTISTIAVEVHKSQDQGNLSKLRASIINKKALCKHALDLNFDEYVIVGNSYQGTLSTSLLEDVFEAFCGALYLDLGFETTFRFLKTIFIKEVINYNFENSTDYKSRLQEEIQSTHRNSLEYVVVKEEGPSHSKFFEIEVRFEGIVLGKGRGKTKKEASQNAAKEALDKKAVGE